MKILQLCKKFPYPLKDGESVAVHSMSKGFAENGAEVSLLAFNTSKHFVHFDNTAPELSHFKIIDSIFLDTSVNPIKAFINLFSNKSFNIERFVSDRFANKLKDLVINNDFDVVQLESLYMVPYIDLIRKHCDAMISMRSHNLEYEIWKDLAGSTSNIFKKWYYNLLSRRLLKYEKQNFQNYDTLIPISENDYNKYQNLEYHGEYSVSLVGLDTNKYLSHYKSSSDKLNLGYIGSLDWEPNKEGVTWFFKNVWPKLKSRFPMVEFHLAGRNCPESLKASLPKEVHFHGEVDSAIEFLSLLDIIVVPLFSGSGIRVKILESMAMSKVVLSTYKGFEGIGIEDRTNAFLFESSNDIINAIESYITDPNLRAQMQNNARKLVHDKFDYKVLSGKLIKHYQTLNQYSSEE